MEEFLLFAAIGIVVAVGALVAVVTGVIRALWVMGSDLANDSDIRAEIDRFIRR